MENTKRAVDEMFSYFGITFGCAMPQVAGIPSRMHGISDEDREKVSKDVLDRVTANFSDALKILGW